MYVHATNPDPKRYLYTRRADFILEASRAFPALLIELENPVHEIYRKNGEPTAQANHAANQIAEWIDFIERDSRNVAPPFDFLAGSKQSLVIMGRENVNRPHTPYSRSDRTIFWTYNQLIREACDYWNDNIAMQARLLGISDYAGIKC